MVKKNFIEYKYIIVDVSGNILLRVLNQRIPDSGEWGGGKEFNDMIKSNGAKTVGQTIVKVSLDDLSLYCR